MKAVTLVPLAAIAFAACAERVAVSSLSAPNLQGSPYHSFAMMIVPQRAVPDSSVTSSDMDPMLLNSPVGQAIRADIVHSFKHRGYTESSAPDFLVAYYAGTGDVIQVKAYPYGYSGFANGGKMTVTDYPAGTVIVDVIDAKTNQLVWRGQGVSRIPNNPDRYSHQIAIAVSDIVAQFPEATKQAM